MSKGHFLTDKRTQQAGVLSLTIVGPVFNAGISAEVRSSA
jgi:hypothetical protein